MNTRAMVSQISTFKVFLAPTAPELRSLRVRQVTFPLQMSTSVRETTRVMPKLTALILWAATTARVSAGIQEMASTAQVKMQRLHSTSGLSKDR